MLNSEFLYLSNYSLSGEPSFGGFFNGAWLYSKRFSLLKPFSFKSVFFIFNFNSLLEFKLLLEIFDLDDQIEVNFKCSLVEKHRRVAILKGRSKFSYSWRTSKPVLLVSVLFWENIFQNNLCGLWGLFGDYLRCFKAIKKGFNLWLSLIL